MNPWKDMLIEGPAEPDWREQYLPPGWTIQRADMLILKIRGCAAEWMMSSWATPTTPERLEFAR